VRKQIVLLLGLVLIGTLGLAAGIEASKGTWDYRSLLPAAPGVLRNTRATTPAPLAPQPVAMSSAPAEYSQDDSPRNPFVQFAIDWLAGQRTRTGGQSDCLSVTAKDQAAHQVSLPMGCAADPAAEAVWDQATAPQAPTPAYERASGNADLLSQIG